MKDHTECKRGFTQLSKAWYGPASMERSTNIDEVTIGFYCPDDGTTGEFRVVWEKLAGRITPCLMAFDDGWNALFNFGDMLESMADIDGENISPDDFCKLLVALDIENLTLVERV